MVEDEDSSGGSSPERNTNESGADGETVCGWRGCGDRFPSVARLSAHVARAHAHALRDGLFYCGWKGCLRPQKGFNARYKMLVHVRTHTNERPHICNQCNKSFSRAENLKIHLRSHSGEKPYICPYDGCGKAYSNSSDRFKHTRTHTVDKPYCCKVPGCNKRYTDPSSLRKHVKTNKHFTTEEAQRRESSDEVHSSETFSPARENSSTYTHAERSSPLQNHIAYSPIRNTISPTIPPYNPILPTMGTSISPPVGYSPLLTYIRPVEPIYPVRVPAQEMSYLEYTQMYDHAHRSYYSNNATYPVLRQSEKIYTYEERPQFADEPMEEAEDRESYSPVEEMPLNLICTKRIECKPIEDLVRRDLPLDLSTKS
ncbi:zinc finger protein GLIS3-like isoform X2 [Achroia grisella]|uniref:zinc finger protein GLIS3-like isoform X2 n=1 Tax=Achroia grisella TaxID=688607 RepID=UPI0027D2E0F0|nr:zinc finger protein GLIS3-like isoform X2 [Achroia grisella]XP_059061211.1 zinc finger protein GLIS3-like isoform X2 [Achroia grisella]